MDTGQQPLLQGGYNTIGTLVCFFIIERIFDQLSVPLMIVAVFLI